MSSIWGTGEGRAEASFTNSQLCNRCNRMAEFTGVVDYRYFHISHTINFLTSRKFSAICSQCGNTIGMSRSAYKKIYKKDNVPDKYRISCC